MYNIYVLSSKESQLPDDVEGILNDKSKEIKWKFIGEVDDLEMARNMILHDKPYGIDKNGKYHFLTQDPTDDLYYDFGKIETDSFIEYYDYYNGEHGEGIVLFRRK